MINATTQSDRMRAAERNLMKSIERKVKDPAASRIWQAPLQSIEELAGWRTHPILWWSYLNIRQNSDSQDTHYVFKDKKERYFNSSSWTIYTKQLHKTPKRLLYSHLLHILTLQLFELFQQEIPWIRWTQATPAKKRARSKPKRCWTDPLTPANSEP